MCLHGTVANGGNWGALAELLLARGRIVVAPTYGERGTAPLARNLAEVTDVVRRTLEITGADRVDLVGHSQGGLLAGLLVAGMVRGRPVFDGAGVLDDASVRRVICISASHRGVRRPRGLPMPALRAAVGPALADQIRLRERLLAERDGAVGVGGADGVAAGFPEVAKAVHEARATGGDAVALPEWFDLVTGADLVVPAECALTPEEYPGATTIRLEERLGRGVPHHLQPHDRGVAELVAELLGTD
ncbi:esterase/lipase family protein [Corynebacterium hansenii]|uniref:Esterase/lipase family protein n=1 Tax=Corynebacterium hansenii TaxID=394964 RepID=A0ABV7ZPA6_9CORY|nr:alpha/beta fold hydrolase [Corynebacterium hansenii]